MAIHYHVNVQLEGGYGPSNDDNGWYLTMPAANDAARVLANRLCFDDETIGSPERGIFVISDPMRGMDPTYLRTYVTVDECESPDCQEVD